MVGWREILTPRADDNMRLNRVSFGLVLATTLLAAGCGGSLYKVKPPITASLPADAKSGSAEGIELHAARLTTDEESQDLFEVNLPLAGVLPVRVELSNAGGAPLELAKARFRLRDGSGANWKTLSPKQTVGRVTDYYDVYLYNPNSRKAFVEAMQRQGLDQKTPLAPGERRTGFLFFQTPRKEPVDQQHGLVMTAEKLPQTVEVALD